MLCLHYSGVGPAHGFVRRGAFVHRHVLCLHYSGVALPMVLSEEVRLYTGTESVSRRVARGQLAVLRCLSQMSVAA